MDEIIRRAGEVLNRVEVNGRRVPNHVGVRAALLLGNEQMVYLGADIVTGGHAPGMNGSIHIFTPTRVIRLRLSGTASPAGDEFDSSVETATWSRALLARLELLGGDHAWEAEAPHGALPSGTGYRLTYQNSEFVEIPDRHAVAQAAQRAQALSLFPSLVHDLASGSGV